MPNFLNLAFFGGGWHKYFCFGIFVIFWHIFQQPIFDILKMLNLNDNGKNGHFYQGFGHKLRKTLATLQLIPLLYLDSSIQSNTC